MRAPDPFHRGAALLAMGLAAGAVLAAIAPEALAQPPSRTFRLRYAHDPKCPDAQAFLSHLRGRTLAGDRVEGEPADLEVEVDVRAGTSSTGTIAWTGKGGGGRREVTTADCSDVVSALALMFALVLDPDERESPGRIEVRPAEAPLPRAETPRFPSAPPHAATPLRVGFGATGGLAGGIAPQPALVGGLFAQLAWESESARSPALRLAWLYGAESVTTDAGSAAMTWWTARASGCPATVRATPWSARACVTFDVGRLTGKGYSTLAPAVEHAIWYGPGAEILTGVALFEAVSLGVDAGVVALLARDRFLFSPDTVAHEMPALAAYGLLSVGGVL